MCYALRVMRIKRVYSPRKYQNPFFRKRRRKVKQISWKVKLLIVGIILLLLGVGWLLFFHQYFNIDNVIVKGSERIDEYKIYNIIDKQLQKKKFFFFDQQNIFSFSKRQTRNEILKSYYVADLKIKKKWPRTIEVSFSERIPVAVWCEDDKYYYIDSNLSVLSQIESLEISTNKYIVLKNVDSESQIKSEKIVKKVTIGEEYLNFGLILAKKSHEINLAIDNTFEINEQESSINMNVSNGPKIYFNVEEDLAEQFKKLEILLTEKLKGERLLKLNYIDLRFGDKIYYK